MSGPGYYIEDVTWTCYFYSGYALHTAYWHDDFGRPRSHGCVNLSPYDAWWIYPVERGGRREQPDGVRVLGVTDCAEPRPDRDREILTPVFDSKPSPAYNRRSVRPSGPCHRVIGPFAQADRQDEVSPGCSRGGRGPRGETGMYAVVETGGKQYRATPGEFIEVEKLAAEVGEQVTLDRVLLVADGDADDRRAADRGGRDGHRRRSLAGEAPQGALFHYVPKKRQRKKTRASAALHPVADRVDPGLMKPEEERFEMAHKKGGGSSRNGRDSVGSTPGREAVRRRAGLRPATSSSGSTAPSSIRA